MTMMKTPMGLDHQFLNGNNEKNKNDFYKWKA